MTPESVTIIDTIVNECNVALFDAYNCAAKPEGEAATPAERKVEVELGSLIGFVGSNARGNILISASEGVLEATSPGTSHRDWIGELSNQLLGRIKNKLIPYGLNLEVAPPVVVSGSVRISGMRSTVRAYHFTSEAGTASAWLRIQLDDGVELVLDENPENQPSAEGDMMLF